MDVPIDMFSVAEEIEIVEKMKKKNNSNAEYADGMLAVLKLIAEDKDPAEIKAYVNNSLKCLETL